MAETPSPTAAPRRPSPLDVARKTWAAWRRLSPFFRRSRRQLLLLGALSLVAGVVESTLIALIAIIAASLASGTEGVQAELGPLALDLPLRAAFAVAVVLALGRAGVNAMLAYVPARLGSQAMADLRRELFDAFVGAAWTVKANERGGVFQSLMNMHISTVSQAVITLGHGVSAGVTFLTLVISAYVLNLPAAVILTVTSVVLFIALRPLARRLREYARDFSAENIEYSQGVDEAVLIAEEVQVFGASPTYREAFYGLIDKVRLPALRTRFLAELVPGLFQSVALLLLVLALIAVSLVEASQFTTLGAVVLILVRALTYGQQVQSVATSMDEKIPFMQRLADAIERYVSHPQQDGDTDLPPIRELGAVSVDFSYPAGRQVLTDITFSVRRGEAVGIAGPSGSGKSTLVQILLRLRDATGGTLLVNGLDARAFRRRQWQERVAYVPQTPQLIWGTVADNIRFYRPDLTDADIEAAARAANIHDDVMSWPDGYETVVGQRVAAVSGGQRQRICLARALAGTPEILILDEATSALDVRSEALVHQALEGLKGKITLFIVSHRLSALSFCDRVLVVDQGRLQAFDTPASLLETNAFYHQLSEITQNQQGA
ncbi:ABC transporter ATP-binding protein [Georgenia thermotolerans]|uniref:ABC transporter ATP-binding protein n=1 Tax=Georgenia thermotolerans TaxID=527326 RepID=UPI001D02073A|nr:ABC transporter ATP-binding protein [Georgenia thermotolerans]